MFKKKLALVLSVGVVLSTLTGCGDYTSVKDLERMESLNSQADSAVTSNYSLSYTDKQNLIYAQVADRTLLDVSKLAACSDNEIEQVVNFMNKVDQQLVGTIKTEDGVLDENLLSYMLAEFEKTPYYWQRTKTTVRGIDSESQAIVVDVDYKTIGYEKDVKKASYIVQGEPNYEMKEEVRYKRWLNILAEKYSQGSIQNEYEADFKEFEKVYGNVEEIIKSQRNETLAERVFETGNQLTYDGCINNDSEISTGTMTVRYILVPDYVLGINLGLTCKHLYTLNFKLDNDCTTGKELFTDEGYATVTDNIYSLIYSYFTCIDESDFRGLYKLTSDFQMMDKYYDDMFDTTYRKHENFSISIFDIVGTHITCGVTASSKIRPKGSNMSFPTYEDRYYVELELLDGTLKVKNMTLLSREVQGEPAISTDKADVSGFVATIDLNSEDKTSIENLICNFGALQLNGDTSSDAFGDTVDLSMTTGELTALQTNMMSLTGVKKAVFLENYQQGTSNYASVKCRELFQDEDNSIVEAEVTYDFILKGGKWYIYGYNINNSVRLDTTNLTTSGSLCLLSPGKIEAYNTQVQITETEEKESSNANISVSFDHEEYTPVKKSGSKEQGLNKETSDTISNTDYENAIQALQDSKLHLSVSDIQTFDSAVTNAMTANGVDTNENDTALDIYKGLASIYYNVNNNRYTSNNDLDSDKQALLDRASQAVQIWGQLGGDATIQSCIENVNKLSDVLKDIKL